MDAAQPSSHIRLNTIMFEPINIRIKAALEWLGDESHRRAFAGIAAAAIAYGLGHEIDSALVDTALIVIVPAALSAWSSRTPDLGGE
ncbi:hypothetical protein VH567_07790 [Sphingomonas sp. 4RDLI-65]|uniref:hypothetical protein n=1 Tax=Sphingomonas sp. 4RDLI-65 TaxID=3111641 RepID=UPI003C188CDB